jgi:hypothetical protein
MELEDRLTVVTTRHADISHDRARDLRREVLLMRAFQSRITGPVLRRIAGPQNILELGMAFWSSRVVLAAVEFGVFTQLAAGPLSGEELMDKLGWHPKGRGIGSRCPGRAGSAGVTERVATRIHAVARCSWTVPSRATSAA